MPRFPVLTLVLDSDAAFDSDAALTNVTLMRHTETAAMRIRWKKTRIFEIVRVFKIFYENFCDFAPFSTASPSFNQVNSTPLII